MAQQTPANLLVQIQGESKNSMVVVLEPSLSGKEDPELSKIRALVANAILNGSWLELPMMVGGAKVEGMYVKSVTFDVVPAPAIAPNPRDFIGHTVRKNPSPFQ